MSFLEIVHKPKPISATELQRLLTECSDLTVTPPRLDDESLHQLSEAQRRPCPPPEPCDDRYLGQCLRTLLAVLPRRNADDLSGELFVAAYQRMLGDKPRDQVTFLTEEAMRRCKWFPTISECLEIMGEWRRRDVAFRDWNNRRSRARFLIENEMDQRRRDERDPPMLTQEDVDAMSPELISLGLKCGSLERVEDGSVRLSRF